MHVDPTGTARRTKMVAELGVMAAVSVILLVLGTLISINTVFFTALASFLVGFAVIKYGFGAGTMLFLGCAVLDLVLNPDKFHVFLYLAMGVFILFAEGSYKLLEKRVIDPKKRNLIHLILRFIVFMAAYIPSILCLPRLIFSQSVLDAIAEHDWAGIVMIAAGILVFVVFDLAYLFVKRFYMHLFHIR